MKNYFFLFLALLFFIPGFAQPDTTETLPLAEMVTFNAKAVDKVVVLKWSVPYSEEFKSFDIERAEDEGEFVKVGSKLAITKSSDAEYDFVDATPRRNHLLRYRLKLIAQNGSVSYSGLQETRLPDETFTVRLKQNPVRDKVELELVTTTANQAAVVVIANSGQQMAAQNYRLSAGINQIMLPASLFPQGLYQLAIEASNQRKTISFIKE
ncbi:T9SS type A sorting domain-containing protein [Flavisolibacter sp. BT320]|nr:T9SS type A sorting domain-containing protein [Flavisolibacter longurius]